MGDINFIGETKYFTFISEFKKSFNTANLRKRTNSYLKQHITSASSFN